MLVASSGKRVTDLVFGCLDFCSIRFCSPEIGAGFSCFDCHARCGVSEELASRSDSRSTQGRLMISH